MTAVQPRIDLDAVLADLRNVQALYGIDLEATIGEIESIPSLSGRPGVLDQQKPPSEDDMILAIIAGGVGKFGEIVAALAKAGEPARIACMRHDKLCGFVDRRLQALRRQGRIRYEWLRWSVVGNVQKDPGAEAQGRSVEAQALQLLREYRQAPKFSQDHDAIKATVALEDQIDAFLVSQVPA